MKKKRRPKINNARFIGRYVPPKGSDHSPRPKNIFCGECCRTGKPVVYYSATNAQVRIPADEFKNWRKIASEPMTWKQNKPI